VAWHQQAVERVGARLGRLKHRTGQIFLYQEVCRKSANRRPAMAAVTATTATEVKAALKAYQRDFRRKHQRDPGRQDIDADPFAGARPATSDWGVSAICVG